MKSQDYSSTFIAKSIHLEELAVNYFSKLLYMCDHVTASNIVLTPDCITMD